MKATIPRNTILCLNILAALAATNALADKYKANNIIPLDQASSWTNNAVPDGTEFAVWDSTVAAENTTSSLGADATWGGVKVLNPGGPVTLTSGSTLTLNGVSGTGIDMSAATRDLTINCDATLAANQTWNVQAGRMLTVGGTAGGPGGLMKSGAGLVVLSGTNTYTGPTAVANGRLDVSTCQSGLGPFSVGPGAMLGVNLGWYGDYLVCNRLKLSNCVLNINLGLGLNGNPTNFCGPMFVNPNSLETRGAVTVNIKGYGLTPGQFPLIYRSVPLIDGDGISAFKLGTLPPGVTSALLVNNAANPSLDLRITAATQTKTWSGLYSNVWNTSASNWYMLDTTTECRYDNTSGAIVGDMVKFDYNSGQISNYINLAQAVKPVFVWFDLQPADLPGGVWTLDGTGSIDGAGTPLLISGSAGIVTLATSNSYGGGTIVSNGTLLVNGPLTGSGAVTVYGGTLGGDGIIAGPVTVQAGGTLSPGTTLGTLTVRDTLRLAGTALMEIDRTGTPSSDSVTSISTLTYGGTLLVTNLGPPLEPGDAFTLFTAATTSGAFAATDLPPLDPNLEWDTSNLSLDGTISVVISPPTIQVTNGALGFDGGQFGFDVTGWAGQVVVVEISTNLLNWLPVSTNTLDSGWLHFSDPEPATPRARFYRARGTR